MAVFKDCQATMLSTQPPRLVYVDNFLMSQIKEKKTADLVLSISYGQKEEHNLDETTINKILI